MKETFWPGWEKHGLLDKSEEFCAKLQNGLGGRGGGGGERKTRSSVLNKFITENIHNDQTFLGFFSMGLFLCYKLIKHVDLKNCQTKCNDH